MAATPTHASALARPRVPPASAAGRRRLGVAALALLALSGGWLAVAAAADDYITDTASAPEPGWLAGPLRGLLPGLSDTSLSLWLGAMTVAYAGVVALADSLPERWSLGVVGTLIVLFGLAPVLLSSDVFGYVAYVRLGALHDLNPYLHGPEAAPRDAILPLVFWRHAASPYGPLFTLAGYPLAHAPIATAVWTLKALTAAAAAGAVALAWRAAARMGRRPLRAALMVGANPLLLLFAVAGAHNDVFVLVAVLAAIGALAGGHGGRAGAQLAIGAGIKASGALLVPFALVGTRRRLRLAAGIGVAGALTLAVTAPVFGTHVLDGVGTVTTSSDFVADYTPVDLLARVLGTGLSEELRLAASGAALIAVVAALSATWRGADWLTCAGWAALAVVLAAPTFMPWYITWLLPMAALSAGRGLWPAALALTAITASTYMPLLGFPAFK